MSEDLLKQIEIEYNEFAKNHYVNFSNQDESTKFESLFFETLTPFIQELKLKRQRES